MSESKTLLLTLVMAIAGASIFVAATSGLISAPDEGALAGFERRTAVAPSATQVPVLTPEPAAAAAPPAAAQADASGPSHRPDGEAALAVAGRPTGDKPAPTPVGSLVAPTPTPPPEPTPFVDLTGDFHPFPVAVSDIRSIDFENGFTFPVAGLGPIVLSDGAGQTEASEDKDAFDAVVTHIVYGDLTRDGNEDALVVVEIARDGYTQGEASIFSMRDGLLDRYAIVPGWPYSGSVQSVQVENGLLEVDRWIYDRWSLHSSTWVAPEYGEPAILLDSRAMSEWIDLGGSLRGSRNELGGYDGAIRARLAAPGGVELPVLSFEVDGPKVATVDAEAGHGAVLRLHDAETGHLVGDVAPGRPFALTGPRSYELQVVFGNESSDSVVLDVTIADPGALRAPTWSTGFSIDIDTDGVRREQVAYWPEFTSADGEPMDQVNALIRSHVFTQRAKHADRVAPCAHTQDTSQRIYYTPTVTSADLVALSFSNSTLDCDGRRIHNSTGLTIDVQAGRVLAPTEIVALRHDELFALWGEAAGLHNMDGLDADSVGPIDTVELRTGGVLLRATVSGHAYGDYQAAGLLTFEELGALVDPGIAARAAAGVGPPRAADKGCIC